MDDAALLDIWFRILGVAGLVVLIAVILLWRVIRAVRRIERLAGQALQVAQEIQAQTAAIWELQQTNQVAEELRDVAQLVERHATEVVSVLHEPQEPA